jgi:hypothetical protein
MYSFSFEENILKQIQFKKWFSNSISAFMISKYWCMVQDYDSDTDTTIMNMKERGKRSKANPVRGRGGP